MPVRLRRLEILAEGKTKIIFQDSFDPSSVLIRSKPVITAGDGAKKDLLKNKDILATTTTANVLSFWNHAV